MTDPDRLTFFLLIGEEVEALRARVKRKLDALPLADRRQWTNQDFSRMIYHLREAQLAAVKAGGSELRRGRLLAREA